ncbi:hypothetical protein FQN54_000420 [Arachnomyces sp. PD_36]|nr:hypothetical protein FQN54_000420 [Arachnomyces sp. PD_36]
MRLNAAVTSAVLSSAALLGNAHADEAADASAPEIERPTFTPTSLKAPFLEQFTDDWESRWTPSHAKKEESDSEEDWAYVGEWAVEEPTVYKGMDGDKGLVVKNPAAHHAISAKFPEAIDNTDNTLVVQYEVKLQNSLVCGGAYMKLLQENKELHAEEFSNASPYVIMFGPDKCGNTNKVHFIFKHKNPVTGEYEEKHLNSPPRPRVNKISTLYTLIVRPDQSFQILVDGDAVKNGTLLDDFKPPVNPSEEIEDPEDTKPEDWVDEAKITDPDATKPDDWDEDAPYEIVDTEATQPEDWLVDEPISIPDPTAEKPEDWDDEEDGDWIPPTVPNPKCLEVSGCGTWEPPTKRNPEYKGKWTAPLIDNPAYKGVWKPRMIPNPHYFQDFKPANFEPMGGIGFEIWTMESDILFDNIYIGHSIDDAEKLAHESWAVKKPVETAEEAAANPKKHEDDEAAAGSFKDNPTEYINQKIQLFIHTLSTVGPIPAVQAVPEVAGAGVALVITFLLLIVSVVGGSSPAPAKKGKAPAKSGKEKGSEATGTGAETSKGGATKRNTRSGGQ